MRRPGRRCDEEDTMGRKDEKTTAKTTDVSPTRTKATWKPGITDDSIPFFRCASCGAVVQGIDGPNGPTFSGLVRRPDVKLPYATNSFAPSCCGAPMEPLVGTGDGAGGGIALDYEIVGGFDQNTLRVFWTSDEGAAPRWIALKTFMGSQLKYVMPDKQPPIVFAFGDEDAYAYCDEDPCVCCTFHCKRGFEIYAYVDGAGLVSLPVHREDLLG